MRAFTTSIWILSAVVATSTDSLLIESVHDETFSPHNLAFSICSGFPRDSACSAIGRQPATSSFTPPMLTGLKTFESQAMTPGGYPP